MTLGNTMRDKREKKGLSKADASRALGISPFQLALWEGDQVAAPRKVREMFEQASALYSCPAKAFLSALMED